MTIQTVDLTSNKLDILWASTEFQENKMEILLQLQLLLLPTRMVRYVQSKAGERQRTMFQVMSEKPW